MPDRALPGLRLLQLVSPSLPTGAFTYSQGLEWAVECGWVSDEQEARQWLQSVLYEGLQHLELPVLARLYRAACDHASASFRHWSHWLYACRETSELRDEETQRARALYTVLSHLPVSSDWHELETWREALLRSHLAGYALAACQWEIRLADLLRGFGWSWLENAVAAAIKLVPLGQTAGQGLLYELSPEIEAIVRHALTLEDHMIGASTPALAIASSLHETQYSRLFRS
ncbi:MAG TPA: urease accessory protein UreF [Gammaproteobacteria bacterium]|nr:urease accessory protein UreF [Gammaproteobacteria bacterium]